MVACQGTVQHADLGHDSRHRFLWHMMIARARDQSDANNGHWHTSASAESLACHGTAAAARTVVKISATRMPGTSRHAGARRRQIAPPTESRSKLPILAITF